MFEAEGTKGIRLTNPTFEPDADTRQTPGIVYNQEHQLANFQDFLDETTTAAQGTDSSQKLKSRAAVSKEFLYASSNRVDEEDLEYQLEQAARAAGFEFRPESWQQQLFLLLDEPNSSFCAGFIGYVIISMIAASSVCLVIETHPTMGKCTDQSYSAAVGFTSTHECCSHWGTTPKKAEAWADRIHRIEAIVVCSFTVELLLRLLLCRHRPRHRRSFRAYILRPLVLVDFLSVAPWWIERAAGGQSGMAILRMLRLGRLFRMLKAAKFLEELQFFVWAFYRARSGLSLLLFLVSMYVICFGAILYQLEYDEQSEACFSEAYFPECWTSNREVGKMAVNWNLVIEFESDCHHCRGHLWNCTAATNQGLSVTIVNRIGDCIGSNTTAGVAFPCYPGQPHYTDSVCDTCSDVQWPGKEPLRCAVRGFTSIQTAGYFVIATMTTVGYGEHYPNTMLGKVTCGVCMGVGILVLALPMVIISQAIEETVKEEKAMGVERERRLKLILLERAETRRSSQPLDPTDQAGSHEDRIMAAVEKDIERLDGEKAVREQYDVEVARKILVHLMDDLGQLTGDSRFEAAAEVLLKPADYYTS